jgi:hypothetical protein
MKKTSKILILLICTLLLISSMTTAIYAETIPELDGKLIKGSSTNTVYFVWQGGYKCAIPDPTTFNNLYRNWNTIIILSDSDVKNITSGPAITKGSLLIKGDSSATVYLLTNGKKHGITSPDVMDYCNFSWDQIRVYPQIVVNSIPYGTTINYN